MATYSEKLKDPRWQRKRLEVLQRDDWCCQLCFNNEQTLVVHHRFYREGREPWDYPDEALVTLCQDCHDQEHAERIEAERALISALRRRGAFNAELWNLALTFDENFQRPFYNEQLDAFRIQLAKLLAAFNDPAAYEKFKAEWFALAKPKDGA